MESSQVTDSGPSHGRPIRTLAAMAMTLGALILASHFWPGARSEADGQRTFNATDAVLLGLVEGITEYLPVSSTGHLLLTQRALGLTATPDAKEAADAYAVIIQVGAILAVLGLYRRRVGQMIQGLLGRDRAGLRLVLMLIVAFLPAAIVGLTCERFIKQYLFETWPIAVGWLVGGLAILLLSRRPQPSDDSKERPAGDAPDRTQDHIETLRWGQALTVGLCQITAMWPGVSRSLATIAGGLVAGLALPAAVEFSFLLGLLTLGAATSYELLQVGPCVVEAYGVGLPLLGIVSSFLAAWVSVKWLVGYLQRHGLAVFGYYRISLALLTALLLLKGLL